MDSAKQRAPFFSKENIMIIQPSYGAVAYSGISASSTQRQERRTLPAAIADPAKNADQVSLSSAGMNALAKDLTTLVEDTNTGIRSNVKNSWLSQQAHSSPELAGAMVIPPEISCCLK